MPAHQRDLSAYRAGSGGCPAHLRRTRHQAIPRSFAIDRAQRGNGPDPRWPSSQMLCCSWARSSVDVDASNSRRNARMSRCLTDCLTLPPQVRVPAAATEVSSASRGSDGRDAAPGRRPVSRTEPGQEFVRYPRVLRAPRRGLEAAEASCDPQPPAARKLSHIPAVTVPLTKKRPVKVVPEQSDVEPAETDPEQTARMEEPRADHANTFTNRRSNARPPGSPTWTLPPRTAHA